MPALCCFGQPPVCVAVSQVLAQGYSVGRVEEMPAAAAAGGRAGGGSSKLLERRLVRIYTPGTAVEGLLLDDQVGELESGHGCGGCLHGVVLLAQPGQQQQCFRVLQGTSKGLGRRPSTRLGMRTHC